MEEAIFAANADPAIHGILIYYPVFGTEQDHYLKDLVDPSKDIEGLTTYWARRLYENQRYVDEAKSKKAILPCTPLAIVKLLEQVGGYPVRNRKVSIFNRSEVVGRPLASMLANDGATVYSFDIDGPLLFDVEGLNETNIERDEALAQSEIVVTGVPHRDFKLIQPQEIRQGAICINFSTLKNFQDDITDRASVFIPSVGPMTITMALRNTLRLYENNRK
jgi:methylenetetrahydrofolate dehydrogenase (NADP+)/methenyltetrahydrofolate cyclohydrolase